MNFINDDDDNSVMRYISDDSSNSDMNFNKDKSGNSDNSKLKSHAKTVVSIISSIKAHVANSLKAANSLKDKTLSRLRRRFVLITMSLVGIVLASMLAANVIGGYQLKSAEIFSSLRTAVGMDATTDLRPHIGSMSRNQMDDGQRPPTNTNTQPIFIVMLNDSQGSYDTPGNMALMDDVVLENALAQINSGNASEGLLVDTGVFFARNTDFGGLGITRMAFADASSLLTSTATSIFMAIATWILAMLVIFAISMYLSRVALQPVADAWQKQRRFIADASHELKTPLTVILANNSILASNLDAKVSEQQQWINSTEVEAERMDMLIKDLLLLAQTDEENNIVVDANRGQRRHGYNSRNGSNSSSGEGGGSSGGCKSFMRNGQEDALETIECSNLSEIAKKMLLQFEAVFFERQITVTSDIMPDLGVHASAIDLERLTTILLDNASKYSPQNGIVHVCLTTSENNKGKGCLALLTVNNSGEPIASDALERIFERFYRCDDSHSNTIVGYGLGLSIAKAIAIKAGGDIWATSNAIDGTTFTIALPLA
jgi:signal transduction histidine kinase